MIFMFEIIGWMGALLVLGAYALLSMKKLSSQSIAYHGMNIAGALLLASYTLWKEALPSVLLNIVWIAIGVYAIITLRRSGNPPP